MDVTHEDGQVENQGRYLPHDTRDDEIGADPLRILDVATAAGLQIATLSRNLHRRDVEELELAGFRQLPAHLITDADQSIMLVGLRPPHLTFEARIQQFEIEDSEPRRIGE